MSASINQLIHPLQPFARNLVAIAGRAGLVPQVTSTRRSHAEQARLYRRFLSGLQPYPVAAPGTSAHEFGYAFDMIIAGMNPSDFADLGEIWKGWGGIWGGAFKDPIHFEYPGFSHPLVDQETSKPSGLAQAADLILGFAPGLSEGELAAELLSWGFPQSQVLKMISNPISYIETHYKTDPGVFAHVLRWALS